MSVWKSIPKWLGITSPAWLHNAVAQRNMPIVAVGSLVVALFSGMLLFCLISGVPCSIDGFDEAAHESSAITFRYTVTCAMVTVMMLAIFVFAFNYHRKKWNRPGIATIVTILFVFLLAMLWGIASSGNTPDRQMLIFASIQFLVAGLVIFDPIVALVYFAGVFFIFGTALDLSGQLSGIIAKDLVYLAILDLIVCWVVYGLFVRARSRERAIVDLSRRDELTGARNRHSLREDFESRIGSNLRIMLCDIDNFKHYNDDFDHAVGDNLLKEFYSALHDAFGDESVYRYGGDEFLVVQSSLSLEEFKRLTQKVKERLSQSKIGDENAGLTYSGGYVCGVAESNIAFRDMLHAADENLLQAKRAGKNRIFGEGALLMAPVGDA